MPQRVLTKTAIQTCVIILCVCGGGAKSSEELRSFVI